MWREELVNQRDVISTHKDDIIEKQKIFDSCKDRMMQDTRSAQMVRIVETLFELLGMHIQKEECIIEEQLRKLDVLLINEYQADDIFK